MFIWSHNRPIRPNVARRSQQTELESWMTVTCLKITSNKAFTAVAPAALANYLRSLHPPCLSPLTRLQREPLLTHKHHIVPALPGPGHKNTASFVLLPELITVAVWLLTRPMCSHINGSLLSPTLPQRLL